MQINNLRNRRRTRIQNINAISMANVDWNVLYPEIKLSGQWLYRRGFHPGRKVKIKSTGTDLIISLIK